MFTWLLAMALGQPIVLPPDEDPAAWASVLQLVGLEESVGSSHPSTYVVVEVDGASWRLRAMGEDGSVREATVPVPQTAAAREAVAQLAASLVRELEAPELPPLPPLPPAAPPKRRPTRVKAPADRPASAVPQPAPAVVPVVRPTGPESAAPAPEVPSTPEAPESRAEAPDTASEPPAGEERAGEEPVNDARSAAVVAGGVGPPDVVSVVPPSTVEPPPERSSPVVTPFAWGGVGLQLRSTVLPAVTAAAWAGAETRWVRLGLGLEGTAPADLTGLGVQARVQRSAAWGGAWARLGPVEPGVVGGVQLHRYLDDGGADAVVLPTMGASLGVFVARPMRLEARAHRDLRRVDVFVGPDRLQVAEPWSVQLGIAWVPFRRADPTSRR